MDAKFVLKIFTVLFNSVSFLFFGSFLFFCHATQKKRNERKKRLTTQVSQILYRDFLYHSYTSHYLLIITTIFVLRLSVTPFFRLRHSSAEKEGKSASWIIGSSKFFTPLWFVSQIPRRRTFSQDVLGSSFGLTRRTCQNPQKKAMTFQFHSY